MKHLLVVWVLLSSLMGSAQIHSDNLKVQWGEQQREVESIIAPRWSVYHGDDGELSVGEGMYRERKADLSFWFCEGMGLYRTDAVFISSMEMERAMKYKQISRGDQAAFDAKEYGMMMDLYASVYKELSIENVRSLRFECQFSEGGKWVKQKAEMFDDLFTEFRKDKRTKRFEAHWMSPDKKTYMTAVIIMPRRKTPQFVVSYYAVDEASGKSIACE